MRELLRLRWGTGKLGKSCGELLEHLAFYGSADVGELSEAVNTRRDNVRRSLKRLETRHLVECSSGTYTLPADFLALLDAELEHSDIKRAERLQRGCHERQKQAYRERLEERRRRRTSEPSSQTGESDSSPEPDADSPETADNSGRDYSEREFRELAAYMRERLPEPPKEVKVAAMCRRLRREDPDAFDSLSLRALGWELSGRGWTRAVYSPATLERALELLDSHETQPEPVAGAA